MSPLSTRASATADPTRTPARKERAAPPESLPHGSSRTEVLHARADFGVFKFLEDHGQIRRPGTMAYSDELKARWGTRPAPESKRVQHARMLKAIATQQATAGVRFARQLTPAQADEQLQAARQADAQAAKPLYRRAYDAVAGALDYLAGSGQAADAGTCAVEGSCSDGASPAAVEPSGRAKAAPAPKPLSNEGIAEIERFAIDSRQFTIRKSPLLAPGETPQLIVIGDAGHEVSDVQARLAAMITTAGRRNPDIRKLLVEQPDNDRFTKDGGLCAFLSAQADCIAVDLPDRDERVRPEADLARKDFLDAAKMIFDAAKRLGQPTHGLDPELHREHVRKHPLHIRKLMEEIYKPVALKLVGMPKLTEAGAARIVQAFKQSVASFNNFHHGILLLQDIRNDYMTRRTKSETGPAHITVLVTGQSHVMDIAGDLLATTKCHVLDAVLSEEMMEALRADKATVAQIRKDRAAQNAQGPAKPKA